MEHAIKQAITSAQDGEVPVGAVLINHHTNEIVAVSGNTTVQSYDPTGHAEINVIRQYCQQVKQDKIPECDLYVTLEPCSMCATAIANARIRKLIFGAYDPKSGGVEHGAKIFSHNQCHHKPEVIGGIMEHECAQILKDFFEKRRA